VWGRIEAPASKNEASIHTPKPESEPERAAAPETPNHVEFVPEFRDLADEDDIDFWVFPDKMIDLEGDGIFRHSEVVARNGESWFVLTKEKDSYSLRLLTAKVKQLRTISWPGDEHDAKLTFNSGASSIIALRNIRGIKAGPVETLFVQDTYISEDANTDSEELSDGYRREFNLGGQTYILRTSQATTKNGSKFAVLVLETEGSIQVIAGLHIPPAIETSLEPCSGLVI
jgi:hypothetical protein